jgi:hypothetical protein
LNLTLPRKHLVKACEQADVLGSEILDSHTGRRGTGAGLTLPTWKANEVLAALAQLLIDDGRGSDAAHVIAGNFTEPKGRALVAYWPDATLTD